MILFAFLEKPETRGASFPCDAFRWALEVSVSWDEAYLELVQQYRFKSEVAETPFARTHPTRHPSTTNARSAWNSSHTNAYSVVVNHNWRWGLQHVYYDGPHCSLSVGPVHFNWGGWLGGCNKCMLENK